MDNKSNHLQMFKNITLLTQVGLTVATPLVICIWGASWLKDKFNLGEWVVLIGIVLGIGSSVSGLAEFIRYQSKKADSETKNPTGFNKH